MTIYDLLEKDKILRSEIALKEKAIFKQSFEEYLQIDNSSSIFQTNDIISDFLNYYFSVKGTDKQILIDQIMQKHHFNYSATVRQAIIILLARASELSGKKTSPLDWPGMIDIQEKDGIYQVDTTLGKIKFTKASPLFSETSSHYIFCNHLVNECFLRSYEFARENKDNCRIVLSYMPNMFYDGHYHAYLKLDSGVLDIASNCFYFSYEDSAKVLNGRMIKELTYEEIEDDYSYLSERYSSLKNTRYNKLLILSLYYDGKDRNY